MAWFRPKVVALAHVLPNATQEALSHERKEQVLEVELL